MTTSFSYMQMKFLYDSLLAFPGLLLYNFKDYKLHIYDLSLFIQTSKNPYARGFNTLIETIGGSSVSKHFKQLVYRKM